MAATMVDVARLAGVSKKTISNYINGYPYMRPETRARIEEAIATLNYKVNISARNLSSGRTGTIALAIPEIANPYFAELAQAVVGSAQRRGLSVLVEVTGGDVEHELALLQGDRGRYVDGLLLHSIALQSQNIDSATLDVPVVLIGDRIHTGRFDFVSVANAEAAYEMTKVLLDRGRRRIVALGMERSDLPTAAALRFHGFTRALAERALAPEESLLVGPIPWTRAAGAAAVRSLVEEGIEFDAVFGFSDALALGALAELQRFGMTVPAHVSVVGFDDVEESVLAYPALTTVDSGRRWIAETAVDRLSARLADANLPTDVLVAQHAIVHRSSV